MAGVDPVTLLSRQYYQLIDPEKLILPAPHLLRLPEVQSQIYEHMFENGNVKWVPPERYTSRVLKKLLTAMEQAIEDPEEDEISDQLSNRLAQYMAYALPSASTAAQQKVYVTYSAPSPDTLAPQITVLEAPSLLASSGTTGFRTWEAALHLGTFLFSKDGRKYVTGKNVLELGAGTGYLSILCARYLNSQHVLATDGSPDVVNDIKMNARLNLPDGHALYETAILQWGCTLISGVADCRDQGRSYDTILGADVTYDVKCLPALVATIRDLFELYPKARVLISATVRNQNTLSHFQEACGKNGFDLECLGFSVPRAEDQIGFFVPSVTPIELYSIKNAKAPKSAFAL